MMRRSSRFLQGGTDLGRNWPNPAHRSKYPESKVTQGPATTEGKNGKALPEEVKSMQAD
jgi:hypothetical protein